MERREITSNVFIVENFWSNEACETFIQKSEEIGYETAKVETEKGAVVLEAVRNNNRILYNDANLAVSIWERLKPFAPQKIGNSYAAGLNELFRFYKYQPGQHFKKHIDQSFIRSSIEASYYTFMIYLNDRYSGGQTSFSDIIIQPKQGAALIFLHSLEHEGSQVLTGTKYVLRSDIMYRLDGSSD